MGAQKLAGRRTSASDRQVRATPPRRGYSRQAVLRRREGLCRAALPWVPGRRELQLVAAQRQRARARAPPRKGAGSPGRWARPQATQHMAMAGAAGRPTQLQGVRVASPSSLHLPSRSSSGNPLGCWLPFPLAIAIHLLPAPTTRVTGYGDEAREPRSICSRAFRHIGRCLTLTLGRTINLMAVLTCNRGDFAGTASH